MLVRFQRRRQFLAAVASAAVPLAVAGCGTLLHPERRGQGSGKLDWRIVGLDAAGLLLFFVPGVIAFAVDFHQGTIFLPQGHSGLTPEHSDLYAVRIPADELTLERIAETVSVQTNQPVTLQPGGYQSVPLQSVESFWSSRDRLLQG